METNEIIQIIGTSIAALSAFFAWMSALSSKRAALSSTILTIRKDFDDQFENMKKLGEFRDSILPNSSNRLLNQEEKEKIHLKFKNLPDNARNELDASRRSVKGVFRRYEILMATKSLSKKHARVLVTKSSYWLVMNVIIPMEPTWQKDDKSNLEYYKDISNLY